MCHLTHNLKTMHLSPICHRRKKNVLIVQQEPKQTANYCLRWGVGGPCNVLTQTSSGGEGQT